jgi:hypothetical protein
MSLKEMILNLPQEKVTTSGGNVITVYFQKESVVFYPQKDKYLRRQKTYTDIAGFLNGK